MTPLESLREQLEMIRKVRMGGCRVDVRFHGAEDLLLQHGRVYTPKSLPENHKLHRYPKACYQNCYKSACRHNSQWIYVEGYAWVPLKSRGIGIALEHAWLTRTDAPGIAFDPTWGDLFNCDPAYFGIPIRREYLVKVHQRNRHEYGVFNAILTGQDKLEDVIVLP